jgi:hypothetical protein
MSKDGYWQVTNMDISQVVLSKMREHYYAHKRHQFQCKQSMPQCLDVAMDATRMAVRDKSVDVAIDKGTYDALAVSSSRPIEY